jgi:hypothetical protein
MASTLLRQQPDAPVVPVVEPVHNVVVGLVDVVLEVAPVEVVLVEVVGDDDWGGLKPPGIVIAGLKTPTGGNGLMPALPNSVEPSGIVRPFSLNVEIEPGVDSGDAVPFAATPDVGQLGIVASGPPIVIPLPSNAGFAAVGEPGAAVGMQLGLSAGLKPPGSSSVAPNGMPVPLAPFDAPDPSVPSGEVVIAGIPGALCAWAAPQLISITADVSNSRRIGTSLSRGRAAISVRAPSL